MTARPNQRPNFADLLRARWEQHRYVCVGLDVDLERLPQHLAGDVADRCIAFVEAIVDSTADVVGAYKPNTAFFEALSSAGPHVLRHCVDYIHRTAPEIPVIVDAKRADIANSNNGSVHYLFDYLEADAITVHPYLGHEAIRPFLERKDRGVFVLCRTSNPGAGELQDLEIRGTPLFLHVASLVQRDWNDNSNCGLVVGATYPDELAAVRRRANDLPLLVPGIGAQGGDIEATVRAAFTARGLEVVINASRSVIYASGDGDFAAAARDSVLALNRSIVDVLANLA